MRASTDWDGGNETRLFGAGAHGQHPSRPIDYAKEEAGETSSAHMDPDGNEDDKRG